jgi:hypothetical protein
MAGQEVARGHRPLALGLEPLDRQPSAVPGGDVDAVARDRLDRSGRR